jgi:APA family basic amino acid/polyamine antiporter
LVLRRIRPDVARPFRVPLCPWLPLAALASCSVLMISLPRLTWLNMAAWIALCIVMFFVLESRAGPRGVEQGFGARRGSALTTPAMAPPGAVPDKID